MEGVEKTKKLVVASADPPVLGAGNVVYACSSTELSPPHTILRPSLGGCVSGLLQTVMRS